ncbi:unnamed protein product [Moneuplotes crassus]|uniref:Uncharacterized protein n=1 Tax=Euplotes crassus TaxID=5936 RepID=A0AAD1U8G4_EUPCR|nr:unnamed protein product [Moneuplotes crassus]
MALKSGASRNNDQMVIDDDQSDNESQSEEIMQELNTMFLKAIDLGGKKFKVEWKSRIIEMLDANSESLKQFILHIFTQILQFSKPDSQLKPLYDFLSHVFTHFSKSSSLNTENLEDMLDDLLGFLLDVSTNGSQVKFQVRSLKLLLIILNNIGRDFCQEYFKSNEKLQEEAIQMLYVNFANKNDRVLNSCFQLYKDIFRGFIREIHMIFDDLFLKVAFTNPKSEIREKSIRMMNLSKAKVFKIHELCMDKEPNVRTALYEKLQGQMHVFKIPEGKLYRFITRGLSENDSRAKNSFYNFLLSFCVKSPEEEVKECSKDESDEEAYDFQDNPRDGVSKIHLNYDFKYEGSREKQVKMTIFEIFQKLKIHKTHYIDGFSDLPLRYMNFVFTTFDREDVLKCVESVYKTIIEVIVQGKKGKSVFFSHFSFIRIAMECTKILLQDIEEGYDSLDPIIPEIDDYEKVFEYFTKNSIPKREELEILSEWSKYSLHMPHSIPSIHESIKNLFLNYISDSDPSIQHYTKIINKALQDEFENERDIHDIEYCQTTPRNFKNIYLKKRTINTLCKPVTSNLFISDPDDVCVIMIIVLFQISLSEIPEFISSVKDAIRTIREDLETEFDENQAEDQIESSIPQLKFIYEKDLNKHIERITELTETKRMSSNLPKDEQRKIDEKFGETISKIQSVKKNLENCSLHEKIINRRTLKIIQILCQLTVKNGTDDHTMTWVGGCVIEHIKNKDIENIDICLSIIVDILLFDKDLSASFLRIYQTMIANSGATPDQIIEENTKVPQIITIIKALFDMFCILENIGLDCADDYTLIRDDNDRIVPNHSLEENDQIRLQLSNKLLSLLITNFCLCCNIHVRHLVTQGLMKILLEHNLGNPPLTKEFEYFQDRIMNNESIYCALIIGSLLINEPGNSKDERNSTNNIVYSQMDETFEIFLRKYGAKRRNQAIQIFEACLFILKVNLNQNLYRKRRNKSSKNEFLSLLTTMSGQKVLRYACILFKEASISYSKMEELGYSENCTIVDKISPLVITLLMCLKLFKENFNNSTSYFFPQIIWEYLEEDKLSLQELTILKSVLKDTLKNEKLTQNLKDVIKEIQKKIHNGLKKREENKEESKEVSIQDDLKSLDYLCEETVERYELFLDLTKDIKVVGLITPPIPMKEKKRPRFTDIYEISNEMNNDEIPSVDYMLADDEDLYFQVYSEYVRQSVNSLSKRPLPKKASRTTAKKLRGRRQEGMNSRNDQINLELIEEESNSEFSSSYRSSRVKSPLNQEVVSISKRQRGLNKISPQYDKYTVKDSQNKNISKMRKEMHQFSQYISSQKRSGQKEPQEIQFDIPEPLIEEFSEDSEKSSCPDKDSSYDEDSNSEEEIDTRPRMKKNKL